MTTTMILWTGFAILMAVMFTIDIGVFNRQSHEIRFREALVWTGIWISLAMAFNCGVYYFLGADKALQFLTGYLIEESLSVDNLFVFIMIFGYFHVSRAHQPKILKWGIIGALVMRAVFILVGIELIERFSWMTYVFGAILMVTGYKMAFGKDEEIHPDKNPLVCLVRRLMPITRRIRGDRFFLRKRGVVAATPLFLTLVVVESSDVIFAIDSIPAVLSVTTDPLIVYTSNIFAIMGLRSLYYLLANVMEMFACLKLGVSFILAFVGLKMLLAHYVPIPITFSLGIIIGALAISILVSLLMDKRRRP